MSKKNNTSAKSYLILFVSVIVIFGGIYLLNRRGGSETVTPGKEASGTFSSLINAPMPEFSLKDRLGKEYSSRNLKGKRIVLFFNEGIMCYPSCWNQMLSLAGDSRFQSSDTAMLAVVIDAPSDWQMAIGKMPELGKVDMIFDGDKSVSSKFGMLTAPSSMHYGSFPGHSYVLIDREGIVRYVYDDPRMGINNDLIYKEYEKLK